MSEPLYVPPSEITEPMIRAARDLLDESEPERDNPQGRTIQLYTAIRAVFIAYRDRTPAHSSEQRNDVYAYALLSVLGAMVGAMAKPTWDRALSRMQAQVRKVAQAHWSHARQ